MHGPPSIRLPAVLHGDYNPDQWPSSTWDEDTRLMREAHVNIATLPVFGWAALQPDEDLWTFEWIDDILDRLARNNIRACLATATASVPPWLTQKYPDVLVTTEHGQKKRHGQRHTFCPNSPNFRRLSLQLGSTRRAHRAAMLLAPGTPRLSKS